MSIERPLTKEEILEAQSKTKSAKQAAKYLNISFYLYKKYSKVHGIYEQHQSSLGGKGIQKNKKTHKSVPLEDIVVGKYPNYPLPLLKERLIRNGIFLEECRMCGFKERRVTDYKSPLTLTFVDRNTSNFEISNLELLCFNCLFLSGGKVDGKINEEFILEVSDDVDDNDSLELYDENTTGMSEEEIFQLQQELINTTENANESEKN